MSSTLFGKDYDTVEVGGGGKVLPPGGYVCTIINAKRTTTKDKGLPMVEAIVDIIDGEYTQYFTKKYEENKKQHGKDAKYPNNGIVRVVSVDEKGNTKKNFKSFVTSIEESNQMEVPRDSDDAFIKAIKGKEIGILFGREQFKSNKDGKLLWSTKPMWFRSTEVIINGEYETPKDKFIESTYPSVEDLSEIGSFSASEDEIPF